MTAVPLPDTIRLADSPGYIQMYESAQFPDRPRATGIHGNTDTADLTSVRYCLKLHVALDVSFYRALLPQPASGGEVAPLPLRFGDL